MASTKKQKDKKKDFQVCDQNSQLSQKFSY